MGCAAEKISAGVLWTVFSRIAPERYTGGGPAHGHVFTEDDQDVFLSD